jgi:hypothetical protein
VELEEPAGIHGEARLIPEAAGANGARDPAVLTLRGD